MADLLSKIGSALGISNTEGLAIGSQLATGNFLQAGLTTLASLGGEAGTPQSTPVDVTAPPAGVDSPATLSPVSQTSSISFPPTIPTTAQGLGMPNQAFIGGLLPSVVGTAVGAGAKLLTKPSVTGLVTGLGGAAAVDFFVDQFGQQKKLVITRKMQRDVKKLFMMAGGDFNMTAELYRMATGRQITGEQVVKIITKTFKNQGPYVTKAAVRKTRSTIRKMETLCDLKDRLCPPKRRAPARRRTMSTSITQVK